MHAQYLLVHDPTDPVSVAKSEYDGG